MTAITIPQHLDEKKQSESGDSQDEDDSPMTRKLCGCVWILGLLLTMVIVIGVALYGTWWYASGESTPSCDNTMYSSIRLTDVDFQKHGRYDGADFDEDCHYDHAQNILLAKLGSQGEGDNATIIHDFNRGLTTRVIQSHQNCFVGKLDLEDIQSLAEIQNGDIQEMHNTHGLRYETTGPIAPEYLERTISPLVIDHCTGFQTRWIEPIDSMPEKRAATVIIITSGGTVIIIK